MKHVTRRALSLLLTLAMLCGLLVTTSFAADESWSGAGTADNPYLIEDAADLTALATNVNSGEKYSGNYFKVTADIEVSNWEPIGYSSTYSFQGDFDGDGHTITINGISSAKQQYNSAKYYGLFGCTNHNSDTVTSKIHDLAVAGSIDATSETKETYVGGIVGYSFGGTLTNCVSTITIAASTSATTGQRGYAGGIAGYTTSINSILYNCYSTATLSAYRTGGITGSPNAGKYYYCFTTASAISGTTYATETECYTAETWAALTETQKDAWVETANAAVSAYSSVDNFWSLGSDGAPTHTTHTHYSSSQAIRTVAPTCTEKGYSVYVCDEDQQEYKADYTEPTGHTLEETIREPATCTEDGYYTIKCIEGDYDETTVLPATGHTPKEGSEVEYATYYEYTCETCGETFIVYKDARLQAMTISGVTVSLSEDGAYEWEYDADGSRLRSTNYSVNNSTSQTTITMTSEADFTVNFDYQVSSETTYDKLTITLDSTTVANAISGSGSLLSYTSDTLAAGTHTLVVKYVKDSSNSSFEDRGYISNIVICSHEHRSNVSHQDATCTVDGYDSFHCDDCGKDIYTVIPALGHEYVDGYCIRDGVKEPTLETVTIGTGTSSTYYYAPYASYYKYSLTEMIYPAEKVGAAGYITELAFQVATAKTLATTSVKIYMGHTSKSAFSSTSDWMAADDLTLVYEGTPTLGTATGWETITLDEEFAYNGTDNLVIAVSKAASATYVSLPYYYTSASTGASLYRTNNSTAAYADIATTTSGTRWANLPNLQLTLDVCAHADKKELGRTAATCTDPVYVTYYCNDCGRNVVEAEGEPLGHDFSVYVETVAPTCTEQGYDVYRCVRYDDCGETEHTNFVPATGHTWDENGICTACGATKAWDGTTKIEPATDENGVYLISYGAELAWFRDYASGTGYTASARVIDNIDMGENTWTPIGGTSSSTGYSGTFDGGGYTITLNSSVTSGYQGLFNYVTKTGVVKNVTVSGSFTGTSYIGGIAAYNYGTIENCVNKANVSSTGGSLYVGGIVGYNYGGDIRNCANEGTVTASGTSTVYVGGIAGYAYYASSSSNNDNKSYIENCYNWGNISASTTSSYSNAAAGGIIGYWYSPSSGYRYALNCYSTGAISANASSTSYIKAGGIIGYASTSSSYTAYTTVTNCWYLEGTASTAYNASSSSYALASDLTTIGSKTSTELKSSAFVTDDIEGYQTSCGSYPVLLWQTAVAHTMPESGSTRVEPTCTEDGYEGYVCTVCGETVGTVIPALGHDWGEGETTTEPTCTEDGVTTYTCQREGCGETTTEAIPALGHLWDEGVVTTAATCTEDGVRTYTCTRACCPDVTRTEVIPATGHTPLDGSEVEYETYYQYTCAVCGETYTVDKKWDGVSKDEPSTDADGVYLIGTGAELAWFADYVNAGNATANAKLTANINLGDSWTPIGKYDYSAPVTYSGTFDGDNHTVTLNVNVASIGGAGLFGYVENANIQDLTVAGTIINTQGPAGGIAALANGVTSFVNCHNRADVTGSTYVGGITGGVLLYNWTGTITITGCSNSGAVETTGSSAVGGIIGGDNTACPAVITNCLNTGSVTKSANVNGAYAGGIAGTLRGSVSNSANTGTITCGGVSHGGIVGYGYGTTITDCYNTGDLVNSRDGTDAKIGGIVGQASSVTVTNSYSAGTITTLKSTTYLGGISGQSGATVTNSYYLDTSVANSNEYGTSVTSAELKDLTEILGEAYKDDSASDPINDGYPVLVWQEVTEAPVPEIVNYTFLQTTQLGLIEPWFLKSNLYLQNQDGQFLSESELNALKDYGVYFVRASELGNPTELPTVEAILNNSDTVKYSKNDSNHKAVVEQGSVGYMITASYADGIYTYELTDSIYVLYYIEDASGIRYDVVKERNLYNIANIAKDNGNFDETERAVYKRMIEMEAAITAHRATFDNIPETPIQNAPLITEGQFGQYQTGYAVQHSVNIVLIEPWGIKLNGYVDGSAELEESGVVVFYDKNNIYETAPSVGELISNPGAYVFSTETGNAMTSAYGNYTKIEATYTKDIYTYQLNANAYVVFFVKIDGIYHFGEVKTRNVLSTIQNLVDNTNYPETERDVYRAMIDMYTDVTTHRAKFGL